MHSLRWLAPTWNRIAHDWRRPPATPPRPDYARIAQLERELGLTEEQPIRLARGVCLTKGCTGDTEDVRTWGGQLLMRIHHCDYQEH